MIKYFRKVRQKLLTENKISKYLLYAIGEILLVVIGILIALQLNIKQENISNQNKIDKYLSLLLKDLEKDKTSVLKCIEFESLKVENINRYIDSNERLLNNSTLRFATYMENFTVHNTTYNSIQSNNVFELIKDIEIQKAISEYYSYAESVRDFEQLELNTQYAYFLNNLLKNKRLVQFYHHINDNDDSINLTVDEDKLFYGYLVHFRDNSNAELKRYNTLTTEIEKLNTLLENYKN
jgi:hypothetical protein